MRTWDQAGPKWGVIVLLAIVLAFLFLGSRGLGDPDEGRYVASAREMVRSGDLIVPTLEGTPHLTKPPLTYWLIAGGMKALGSNEWGGRAFGGCAFAATALVLAALGAAMSKSTRGRLAAVIYLTMLTPFVASSLITPDSLLVLFITSACAFFWCGIERTASRERAVCACGMWGSLGLAFLTKGTPGLLPLLVALAFIVVSRDTPRLAAIRFLFHPLGLLIFLLIATPWFVAAEARVPGLMAHYLRDEVLGRIVTGEHGRNLQWYQPLKIYLPPLTLGTLPWCVVIPLLRARHGTETRSPLREDRARLFCWLWFSIPIILFSLIRARQVLYILPAFAPLALLFAHSISARAYRGRPALRVAALIVWVALLGGVRYASAVVPTHRDVRLVARFIERVFDEEGDRLLIADRNLHALAFYLDTSPSRSIDQLQHSRRRTVIVASGPRRKRIERRLIAEGIAYRAVEGPVGYELFVVPRADDRAALTGLP